jgi:alanine dehydrogenase
VAGAVREDKYAREPGTYCGLLLLFSTHNAEPLAIMHDGILQHDRVAGGAGLGVKYLSREDSHTVGMLGSGGMARAYLDAFKQVRDITHVKVFSPNPDHVRQYADEMAERHGIPVEPVGSAREAVRGVDVAALCTSSVGPVFFPEWLEPGMHVADVGRAGTPVDFIEHVDVAARPGPSTPYLGDLPSEAFYARGGFLGWVAGQPAERDLVPHLPLPRAVHDLPRLPDLMTQRIPGRTAPEQTSWFLNVGCIGEQFAAVAAAVYYAARDRGLGTEIPTDWFLQDIRD